MRRRLDWPYNNLRGWKLKGKHMLEKNKIGLMRRKGMGIRIRNGSEGAVEGKAGQ